MITLGARLRELREKQQISQRRLAARARITAPYLSDLELDRRHPSARVLGDLARALATSVDDLIQHDPRALLDEIERRIASDGNYAHALRHVIRCCPTAEELMRICQ